MKKKVQKKNDCKHQSHGTLERIDGLVNKYICSVCDVVFYRPKSYGNYPSKFKQYMCNVKRCKCGGVIKRNRPHGDLPVWWCTEHIPEIYIEEFKNARRPK